MPFKKGDDPNRLPPEKAREAKNKPRSEYCRPRDPSAPQALLDIWHVYNNDKSHDKTPAQKSTRLWMEKDPRGFRKEMEESEADLHRSNQSDGSASAPDKSTQECVALARALLVKLKGGGM